MTQNSDKKVRNGWQLLWALLILCAGASVVAPRAQAVPVQVIYADGADEGFNDPTLGALRRRAFEAAASVWSQRLPGTIPVRIKANFDPLGGSATLATLGQAGPAGFFASGNGFNPPLSNTFYVKGLANQFAGGDLDPTTPDIVAFFNSDVDNQTVLGDSDFYYGLDGRPPTDANGNAKDSDFFAVVLHELGHGLGFTGLYNGSGFSNDAISSFDRYVALGANGTLITSLGAAQRSAAVRSNNLFFVGPKTRTVSSSGAKLYAPASFSGGSSIYHLDEDTYSGAEELMTPFATGNPHAPGPLNYAIFLDVGWGQVGGSTPLPTATPIATATPVPGPPNDDFVNAQPISGATGSVTGTSVRATRESGEPVHANTPGGASIWYRWTAPSSGSVVFSTAGSGFDTVMAVYTGSQLTQLTPVTANDDQDDNIRTSRVQFDAVSGQTYAIAIDGYSDATTPVATGSVVLRWQLQTAPTPTPAAPKPANDDFASAQVLAGNTGSTYGTNVGATLQSGEPLHGSDAGGHSIWYSWAAPSNGQVTFEINGDGFVPQMAIYTGNVLNTLTRVATATDNARVSRVTFRITSGVIYQIAIDGRATGTGRTLLRWLVKPSPPNDDFENARVLTTNSGTLVGDTTLATNQNGEPRHAADVAGASIWYRWTAPADGVFAMLVQARFVPVVAPYTGSAVTALTPVAPSLATDSSSTSRRDWQVRAGVTYSIAVAGRANGTGPTGGLALVRWRFTSGLTTTGPNPPPNTIVTPSSVSSSTATSSVGLSFSTPSDASRFLNSFNDSLTSGAAINGVQAAISDVGLKDTTVTIYFSKGALRIGDAVQIQSSALNKPIVITVQW